jgi:Apea-like HEPN
MDKKEIAKEINKLKAIARFGRHQFMGMSKGAAIKMFGEEEDDDLVSFISVGGLKEFYRITGKIYKSQSSFVINYSTKGFEEEVVELLRSLNKEDREAKVSDIENFSIKLDGNPSMKVKVIAPISGITMVSPTVELGSFVIYKSSEIFEILSKEYTYLSDPNSRINFDEGYKISISVEAKDMTKCYELADKAFRSFENVANFIVGGFHKTWKIGIFNHTIFRTFSSIILTDTQYIKSVNLLESFETRQIDNIAFRNEENGNNVLWMWITANKNDLQQTVMDSIDWCGKAVVESDDSKAILQYVISIETLLHYDETKLINPSIISKLTDNVAFLLAETYEKRLGYVSMVKNLYSARSAITHGGGYIVDEMLLHGANVLCHHIIRAIVTKKPYNNFSNKKSLCDHLAKLKYGAPGENKN